MAPKPKKNALEMDKKNEAKNDHKIDLNRKRNGAKMEPKRHPKIVIFLVSFLGASGNIDGTASGLRACREPAASVVLSAAEAPRERRPKD